MDFIYEIGYLENILMVCGFVKSYFAIFMHQYGLYTFIGFISYFKEAASFFPQGKQTWFQQKYISACLVPIQSLRKILTSGLDQKLWWGIIQQMAKSKKNWQDKCYPSVWEKNYSDCRNNITNHEGLGSQNAEIGGGLRWDSWEEGPERRKWISNVYHERFLTISE